MRGEPHHIGKQTRTVPHPRAWTDVEDKIIRAGRAAGESSYQILTRLPGRTISGVKERARAIGVGLPRGRPRIHAIEVGATVEQRNARTAAERGSRDLLRAMLAYGLRHDSDLGLPITTFIAQCNAVGLHPSPTTTKEHAHV
jgi:hypothetical protein